VNFPEVLLARKFPKISIYQSRMAFPTNMKITGVSCCRI